MFLRSLCWYITEPCQSFEFKNIVRSCLFNIFHNFLRTCHVSGSYLKALFLSAVFQKCMAIYKVCLQCIKLFQISWDLVILPWCYLATNHREFYFASRNKHTLCGYLVGNEMSLNEFAYCVTVASTIKEQVDPSFLVQGIFGKISIHLNLSIHITI